MKFKIKYLALALGIALVSSLQVKAQEDGNWEGKISLTPIIDNEGSKYKKADKILLDKLKRVVLANGMSDFGVNNRFIITANPVILDQETTSSVPPKTVVNLTLTFYVGDAVDGKLFGSYSEDLKGIGNSVDDAMASAYKKLDPRKMQGLTAMIDRSKQHIMEYFDSNAPALLSKAQAAAGSGNYGECYDILLSIPAACSQYQEAQNLLVKYRTSELDNANKSLMDKARAAWSASPDESGASQATGYMAQISCPTDKVRAEMSALNKEISARLKKFADDEKAREAKLEANAHAERMALIKGATQVAVAQAKRPVYHIHRWGWW